jgi:copper homeostasis protein
MIDIEICLGCDDSASVTQQIKLAHAGGATRVELCSSMHHKGLTPSIDFLQRAELAAPPGLTVLTMIRPRGGDFCYSTSEVEQMKGDIKAAGQTGIHGVVLGALTADKALDIPALQQLLAVARECDLPVTFHRAFDALQAPEAAIDTLAKLGVQRILTAGAPWGNLGSALENISQLQNYLHLAKGQLELVIAGGINPSNAAVITDKLRPKIGYAFHAYSSVLTNAVVDEAKVRKLYQAVNDT